jgi:hypothetical protein
MAPTRLRMMLGERTVGDAGSSSRGSVMSKKGSDANWRTALGRLGRSLSALAGVALRE